MVDIVVVAAAAVTILVHEERKKRGLGGGPERVAEHPLLPARARRAAEQTDELPAGGHRRLVRVWQREPELQLHPIDHFPLISSALRALICVVTAPADTDTPTSIDGSIQASSVRQTGRRTEKESTHSTAKSC